MNRALVPFTLLVCVAACSTPSTPYQPFVPHGSAGTYGGYSEKRLGADRYLVQFRGNLTSQRERVETYMLYRAAQLTLQNGDDWFLVVERKAAQNPQPRVHPQSSDHRPHGPRLEDWRYYSPTSCLCACACLVAWRTWPGPIPAYQHHLSHSGPIEATAEIVMHKGAVPPGTPRAFDARAMLANGGLASEPTKR